MKKRFSEEQIIAAVKRVEGGTKLRDVARELGVADQTLYYWKKKFRGMEVHDAKKMRALEHENTRLKKLVARLALDNEMLRDVNSKNW